MGRDPDVVRDLYFPYHIWQGDIWYDTREFTVKQAVVLAYLGKSETVEIPHGVRGIGAYAFRDCTFIKTVIIPDTVTDIAPTAFAGCGDITFKKP